jgi:hypothetical protein
METSIELQDSASLHQDTHPPQTASLTTKTPCSGRDFPVKIVAIVRMRHRLGFEAMRASRRTLLLAISIVLPGCAQDAGPNGYSLASTVEGSSVAAAPPAAAAKRANGYVLSAEEKDLDCRRLTGRMKIRIVQMKSLAELPKSSELSRSMHAAHGEVAGGLGASSTGAHLEAEAAQNRAMLEAYNSQLAAKGCKTLDLAAELNP